MQIGHIISFVIANALTSCLGSLLVKKRYPKASYPMLVGTFFLGYIIFFWAASKL